MKRDESSLVGKGLILPFVLITSCFALWGFANDITNPMVQAFSTIFKMSATEGSLVQVAFYGGYFAMAFPAAIFIRKHSYKAGVLVGLGMYATGALMFLPARFTGSFYPFLLAYFVLTCGLSFLETSCNPYILEMGPEGTATRRLNLAQSFNPMGSLLGMFVAMNYIQAQLDPRTAAERALLGDSEFAAVRDSDLSILIAPYLTIGMVIICIYMLIWATGMPKRNSIGGVDTRFAPTMRRLWTLPRYREGVIAQFFYVGAQIMCWTFVIHYGTHIFMTEGMGAKEAGILAQRFNIVAMALFCCSRFVCTFFLRYIKPGLLLAILAVAAMMLTVGVIACENRTGMYCLVGVSGCMSLMFPTIYGIALTGLGDDAKLGAAGLIMAILGGSVLPPLQAAIIDCGDIMGMAATNLSFVLPFVCFVAVAVYGFRTRRC